MSRNPIVLGCIIAAPLAFIAVAQQSAAPKSASNKGTTAPKQQSSQPKFSLKEGLWAGDARTEEAAPPGTSRSISFTVSNGSLTGSGQIPAYFSCKVPQEVKGEISPGISVRNAMAVEVYTRNARKDFSTMMHFSGPNTFTGTFSDAGPGVTYTIVLKGKFESDSAATGSITVRSSTCKAPTVYDWSATPKSE